MSEKKCLTVGITVRGNDSRLLSTIENVKRRTSEMECEIIVVCDGPPPSFNLPDDVVVVCTGDKPRGTSVAKHIAMMNAEFEIVVLCDSHMDFPERCFDMYYDHLTDFPNHVLCSAVNMISATGEECIHYGGCFKCKIIGDPADLSLAGNRVKGSRQPFGVGWKSDRFSGPIQGIMGGCYGLTKSFYDQMLLPWQYGRGWGGDEESISLAAWYAGGLCWMLPQVVTHYSGTRGFVEDTAFQQSPIYNRRRVVEMIDDRATREDFLYWFHQAHRVIDPDYDGVIAWREEMGGIAKRNFVDLIDDWQSKITVKELYYVQQERGIETKANIRKAEMIKRWRSEGDPPPAVSAEEKKEYEKPEVHFRANYGSYENRRICHACGSPKSKVLSTRTVHRQTIRYRECLNCKAVRPTQEIIPLEVFENLKDNG